MDNLKIQIENLRLIIKTNVETLKKLLKQNEELTDLIDKLSKDQNDILLKEQFEKLKTNIADSIDNLITQTEQLINTYQGFVKEASK